MFKKKTALFVGAHFDDIEIGCSGTILNLIKKKYKIVFLIVTDSVIINHQNKIIRSKKNILKESLKAFKILNVKKHICLNLKTNDIRFDDNSKRHFISVVEKYQPSIMFTHHPFDLHFDHQIVGKISLNFSRKIPNVYLYRSNFYKNIKNFNKNCYVDISKEFEKKIMAISCYKSELKRVGNSWKKYIESENRENGIEINSKYAEAFEIFRSLKIW